MKPLVNAAALVLFAFVAHSLLWAADALAHRVFVEVKEAWGTERYELTGCDQRDLEPGDVVTLDSWGGMKATGGKGYCLREIRFHGRGQPGAWEPEIGTVTRRWTKKE